MAPSAEDVRAMKVAELKAALAERGLPVSGKKEELAERLLEALASPGSPASASGASSASPIASPVMQTAEFGSQAAAQPCAAAPPAAATSGAPGAPGADPLSLERLRARQARFGVAVSGRLAALEEEAARERRQARFGARPAA